MNVSEVELICGETPAGFIKEVITDSNFVFEVDPSFTPINLYNFWGNSATVNSFTECVHYVEGGFKPTMTTIFDIGFISVMLLIGSYALYKFFKKKYYTNIISIFKKFINYSINNAAKTFNYLIFPLLLIQNYFLFDYIRTKAVRIPRFIDEYISLSSNVSFFNNFDFNAGDIFSGSYSVLLTSGPISAIGGVIGWNLTSKLVIARISNFYWIFFLQLLLSLVIAKVYKSEYKFLLFMNSFSLILIPWWQGSLYMIGEFASVVIFVNAIYLFNRYRNFAMFLFSLSIFFGKLLTLLPFSIFYILSLTYERKIKTVLSDYLFFSIPLFSWLILVNSKYENGNIFNYIENLFSLVLGHQSAGFEDSNVISEVSSWNNYELVRVLIIPILFIYLITKNKNKIDSFFGKISLPLIGSTIASYLWFWILSPTKWLRYSQHFTIVLIISLVYFLSFKVVASRFDLFILSTSLAIYIDNTKNLIFIFVFISICFLFFHTKFAKSEIIKVLLILFIFVDIAKPYFEKDTFGNMHHIIKPCQENLVSPECLNSYESK